MSQFETHPQSLKDLLRDSHEGKIKLPEFQRSWVWDEDRIKSLIASVSMSFPIGALMGLRAGGAVSFADRPIEGTPPAAESTPSELLVLDGQQRITSLYQSLLRKEVVVTRTIRRNKVVKRWFYIDMEKALDRSSPRENAIIGVPEDRIVRRNFAKEIVLDLSTPEREYECGMFPLNQVFSAMAWYREFHKHFKHSEDKAKFFFQFHDDVTNAFEHYHVPIIRLDSETTLDAVCLVFEKVNTGGKALDTFELVTAMYAAQGFNLRENWLGARNTVGRRTRLRESTLLHDITSTDFLQVISLLHTKSLWRDAKSTGRSERDLPAVTASRQSLLRMPLEAYQCYADSAEDGLKEAAKFLHELHIYRIWDLPYQSQLIPLAAILAEIGLRRDNAAVRARLAQWFWAGVFGESYGSATDTRFALDTVQVPSWTVDDGEEPVTVSESVFRADRLDSLRRRNSAAYKGLNVLLMAEGARDFRSGKTYAHTVFFEEGVDIHHIFPQAWCKQQRIPAERFNSIVNKTPLSWRTNRMLGGNAPSRYLRRLEQDREGSPGISPEALDEHLRSHMIDPSLLRNDDFDGFYGYRKTALLAVVERAMGKKAYRGDATDEPERDAPDEEESL